MNKLIKGVIIDETARWSQAKIIYNARKNSYYKEELLDDSWCWEKGVCAERQIEVAPQSVLILGRK